MAASVAKLGRVACLVAHQNDTQTRGAASPRSASPIGPAPTLLPRMALPLLTDHPLKAIVPLSQNFGAGYYGAGYTYRLVINQPAEGDNTHEPQDPEENGDPVQVPLDDGGGAEGRGHSAAEQVRQAAALAFVQQDEQDHHETGDDQDNRKPDLHRCYPTPAADIYAVDIGTAGTVAANLSLRRQLTIPADLS